MSETPDDVRSRQQGHLVITVHGIRTFGQWQERLEELLKERDPTIQVRNYRYGYFSLVAYFLPFVRWMATFRFRRELRRTIQQGNWSRVDIVAHSFGTYLVGWGLRRLPPKLRPRINTLIFAGSVLRLSFPWHNLREHNVGRVINECGTRDLVLVAGQIFVLFSGMAGRVGLSGMTDERFRNRYYRFGHSGYFLQGGREWNGLMRERWVPLLTQDEPAPHIDERTTLGAVGGLFNFILNSLELFKVLAFAAAAYFSAQWYVHVAAEADLQRARAQSRKLAAISSSQMETDPELSLLLAIEAVNRSETEQARDVLRESLLQCHIVSVLKGHEGIVESVDYSSDGRWVVTGSADRTARLWDAVTGKPGPVLRGHPDRIRSVAFSPDCKRVLTAGWDPTARVWATRTGEPIVVLKGHTEGLDRATFTSDGERIITSALDKTARIWDARTGRELALLKTEDADVKQATFDPEGKWVVSVRRDGTARIRALEAREETGILLDGAEGLDCAVFTPDGESVVTRSREGVVAIWERRTGKKRAQLASAAARDFTFSPNGRWMVTLHEDGDEGVARVWDMRTGEKRANLRGHLGSGGLNLIVWGVRFSASGEWIVTSGYDGTARVWESVSGAQVAVLRGHTEPVSEAAFSPDGRRVATVSPDHTVRLWRSGIQESLLVAHPESSTARAHFSPRGDRVVTIGVDRTARVWDVDTGDEIALLKGHTDVVKSGTFSRDGLQIVTTSKDQTARVWDVEAATQVAVCKGHTGRISSASFSPHGRQVLTAAWDGTVRVWEAGTGKQRVRVGPGRGFVFTRTFSRAFFSPDGRKFLAVGGRRATVWNTQTEAELWELEGQGGSMTCAEFSRDGAWCVTGSDNGTARVWSAETGRQLAVLEGHDSPMGFMDKVVHASFSPDGEHVVTSSWDSTARVWDARTGMQRVEFRGHKAPVTGASYSPDGRWIVTTGWDGHARIWEAATAKQVLVVRGDNEATFSADGERVYTTDKYATARVYKPEVLVPLTDLIRLARQRVTRRLTPEERAKYLDDTR